MEFQIDHLNEVCSREQVDAVFLDFEGIENDISNAEMNDYLFLLNTKEEEEEEEEDVHSYLEPSHNEEIDAYYNKMASFDSMSIFPLGSMEFDILHLIMAYCEAMEKEQMSLADVISKGIINKGNPSGKITERLLCYLFLNEAQLDYLKQECMKNFLVFFRAFYHIFPYGMFTHFAANSMILNAIHNYTETIHIFDFDIGTGVQWSSLISSSRLQHKELKITSIKWSIAEFPFTFEETKKNLDDTARALGLKFTMDELGLCDIKKTKKKNTSDHNKRDFYFFNCMVNLPHMMIARSRKDVMEFTTVAEQFASDGHNVVVTLGDGNAYNDIYQNQAAGGSLCSFFEENLTQYRALLESMDYIFPKHLEAAKTAMGCLFVAPFVSSHSWIRNWELGQKELLQWETVLKGLEVNEEIILESKLMVTESDHQGLHQVKVEGENKNEIVLSWRNHPLIRVSCWKS